MDEKIKELISIGASVAGNCQICLKYHIEQAVGLGISSEEICTAIEIGKTVAKGALKSMTVFSKKQMEILNELGDAKPEKCNGNCCGGGDSCCSN